jgi:hypothetical protein
MRGSLQHRGGDGVEVPSGMRASRQAGTAAYWRSAAGETDATRVPTSRPETPAPSSTTVPAPSMPRVIGSGVLYVADFA